MWYSMHIGHGNQTNERFSLVQFFRGERKKWWCENFSSSRYSQYWVAEEMIVQCKKNCFAIFHSSLQYWVSHCTSHSFMSLQHFFFLLFLYQRRCKLVPIVLGEEMFFSENKFIWIQFKILKNCSNSALFGSYIFLIWTNALACNELLKYF